MAGKPGAPSFDHACDRRTVRQFLRISSSGQAPKHRNIRQAASQKAC